MADKDFLAELHQLLGLQPNSLSPETSVKDVEGLKSSLILLGLLAMADEEFGAVLSPSAVLKCVTIKDLLDLVESQSSP